MTLFDRLVDEALRAQTGLAPLRPVVEKELLHHDILRELAEAGLLHRLTFIGGTCLRACYGSHRLSEDLNFTGGADFDLAALNGLGPLLVERLAAKYGLAVSVSEPEREKGLIDTWKIRVLTHPEPRDLPAQRINIDTVGFLLNISGHRLQPPGQSSLNASWMALRISSQIPAAVSAGISLDKTRESWP